MNLTSVPLFPLPICLMPGGQTELRIFEPRYKRLVSEASTNGVGFGLCLYQPEQQLMPGSGCLARIVDFEQRDDGLLGILIEGQQRFTLNRFLIEKDGLKRGEISLLDNWLSTAVTDEQHHIAAQLKSIHCQHRHHFRYDDPHYDDLSWVCQRWLEIIPVELAAKHKLMQQQDHHLTLDLLAQIVE